MKNFMMKIVGLFKIKKVAFAKNSIKWIVFWLGVLLMLSTFIYFFWSKDYRGNSVSISDTPSQSEQIKDIAIVSDNIQSSQENQSPLSAVKFFATAKTKDDNSYIVIILFVIAGSMIAYFVYANKDNIV